MEDEVNPQRAIDEEAQRHAQQIVDAQPLRNMDEARRFAVAWICTAMQHARNETYWRERALMAEAQIADVNATDSHG